MQTVNISDFRANLLKYLEKANVGEKISVTTNGKLLATITPPLDQKKFARQALMQLAKTATIHDVVNPTEADWVHPCDYALHLRDCLGCAGAE